MRYWLGPWVWNTPAEGASYWEAPTGTLGSIDLRAASQCAAVGGTPQGVGVFVTANATDLGSSYRNLGTDPSLVLNSTQRSAWQTLLGLPNALTAGASVQEALYETITFQSDPLGERCYPLLPAGRYLEVWLGGNRVFQRLFRSDGVEAAAVRELLQREYRAVRQRCLDGELPANLYRKVLGYWSRKYGIGYRWFQPQDLPDEADLPPETSYSDNFNRANENLTASGWAAVSSTWSVDTNRALHDVSAEQGSARYESDLSGTDHYAELDIVSLGSSAARYAGPAARFAGAADTYYVARVLGTSGASFRISKKVAGTFTDLGTGVTVSISLPDTARITCNGSSIKSTWNAADQETITDTSITTGTRGGMSGSTGSTQCLLDNFSVADLAAGLSGPLLGPGKLLGGYLTAGRLARN